MAKKRTVTARKEKFNDEDRFVYPIDKFKISDELCEQSEYILSYFRQFPYAFCEQYLGIKLYDYQKIIIYEMMHKYNVMWIACRNLAKTFMSALFICTRCILYPKTKVIITAPERQQAVETITKIKELMVNSPMLREEISVISDSVNTPKCLFWNGSTVHIATMSEGSRHYRANLVLVDEFVKADADILVNVIQPVLGDPRRPLYLNDPKYNTPEFEYLKEKDTSIYCSSAGRKGSWSYEMFKDYFKKMIAGEEDYFVCDLPYQTAVSVGLRRLSYYAQAKTDVNMSEDQFKAEYEGIWIADNENGFYKYESLNNCRELKKAVYSRDLNKYIESKNKKFLKSQKPEGAIRICGGDIATVSGLRRNDASAFGVLQLIPKEKVVKMFIEDREQTIKVKYYDRELIFIETLEGVLVKDQVNRLKQLYTEYNCDYMVIDSMTSGVPFVQALGEPSINPETGEDYPAFMCCNKDEYAEMCNYPNALKVLYCITATAQSNHDMNMSLQTNIQQNKIKLLINENTAKDYLRLLKGYDADPDDASNDNIPRDIKTKLIAPYIQTKFLIEEMVALEKKIKDNGMISLKETTGNRKDRYSCLLYLNYVADVMESKLKQPDNNFDYDEDDEIVYFLN